MITFNLDNLNNCIKGLCKWCSFGFISEYDLDKKSVIEINSVLTNNIFSFSLFISMNIREYISKNLEEIKDINNINKYEIKEPKIIEWYYKYGFKQYNKFLALLENKDWQDYCIVHFISPDVATIPFIEVNNSKYYYTNINLLEYYCNTLLSKYRGRYFPLIYKCNDFSIQKKLIVLKEQQLKIETLTLTKDPFFGSLVRFLPLIFPAVDVVLFRDAHQTMPNNKNTYDLTWKNYWLNNTNKRFWMYTSIYYTPQHTNGEKTPFAATWGARKFKGEDSIFTIDQWVKTFGFLDTINNNSFFKKEGYGIDERMFYYVINNWIDYRDQSNFINNTYLIGITWIIYLFSHPSNIHEFGRYNNPNATNITPSIETLKTTNPKILDDYIRPINFMWTNTSYFNEIRCTLVYMIKFLSKTSIVTINSLWSIIEEKQRNLKNANFDNSIDIFILFKLYSMIPSRYHLWETLFDHDIDETLEITTFLNNFSESLLRKKLNIFNSCDIVSKYFIGNDFDYNKYTDNIISILPNNIPLPENHPLHNINL